MWKMGKSKVILFVIVAGLYAILAVGYFKMVMRAFGDDWGDILLSIVLVSVGLVSLIWPLAIVYLLVKEAIT